MKQEKLLHRLYEKGLINKLEVECTPLTGGVSCDIFVVDDGSSRFVVKKALEKLNVKEDWFADITRNKTEQLYLKYVNEFLPEAVPKVIYSNEEQNFFCMEMLENGLQNWKELLLNGQFHQDYAVQVGNLLGQIHSHSTGDVSAEKMFNTLENFKQLRLDPYLFKTGERHPDLASYFKEEADRISNTKSCLIHGDFSPKNILVSNNRIVVLDCEVAWYGDPVFDVAFLLNHFFLKALFLPNGAQELIQMSSNIWNSYKDRLGVNLATDFEKHLTHLLPMLMLARVDGKSPVEYLNKPQQEVIRVFVKKELNNQSKNIKDFQERWMKTIKK